jgi:hypothetical protein
MGQISPEENEGATRASLMNDVIEFRTKHLSSLLLPTRATLVPSLLLLIHSIAVQVFGRDTRFQGASTGIICDHISLAVYAGYGCLLLKLAADAIWKCLTGFACRIVAGCLMRTATYVSNILGFKSTKPVKTVSSSGTAQRQNRRRLLLRRPVT